ncbi:6885_t:CDS:2, partial [Dentiscutata erythropus]
EDVANMIFELLKNDKNVDDLDEINIGKILFNLTYAIVNVFGKVAIEDIPGQKASKQNVLAFRDCCSKLNQEFAIAVINMMVDLIITTTSLTSGEIQSRMEAQSKQINNVQMLDDNTEDNNVEQHSEEYKSHFDHYSDISHPVTSTSLVFVVSCPFGVAIVFILNR